MNLCFTSIHPWIRATAVSSLLLAACGDDGGGSTGTTGTTDATDTPGGMTTEGPTTGTTDATTSGVVTEGATTDATTTSGTATTGEPSSSGSTGGGMFHVEGKLEYEFVPFDADNERLDYDAIEARPIRGATVHLLDADTDVELASTVSDDLGAYAFDYTGAAKVKLWVYAETLTPSIVVEDNTDGDGLYIMESDVVDSGAPVTLDALARTGWTGMEYGEPRIAAPFAILDAAYTAARRFLDETTPAPDFVPLKLNWSVENRPESGDKALGQIGTSHWDGEELYILGKQDVDCDEFDTHVSVHEWCHYFQSTVGRSDTPGGPHGEGDVLDPRVAWSEGACNAFSGILLDPDFLYSDTSGPQQASAYTIDLPVNDIDPNANPGWYAERTVAGILVDLYDGKDEPFDQVALGLQPLYTALLDQKTTESLTTVFSFVAPIKGKNLPLAGAIDKLVAYNTADADLGISAIKDDWGTGETHDAGFPANLPVYADLTIGGMATRDMIGGEPQNTLAQNRYFKFTGDGMPVTVTVTCASDVDFSVYDLGQEIAYSANIGCDEDATFDTAPGKVYVINVKGFNDVPGVYSFTLSLSH